MPAILAGRESHRPRTPVLSLASSAADAGIMKVVTAGQTGGKTLIVVDPEPISQVTRRLIAVLDDAAPGLEDVAFAVLADAAGIARSHLHVWDERRRARLCALRHRTGDGDAARVLLSCWKAIRDRVAVLGWLPGPRSEGWGALRNGR